MQNTHFYSAHKTRLLMIFSVALSIILFLTVVAFAYGIGIIAATAAVVAVLYVNPFGLGENVVLPAIIFVALKANNIYINLRYDERWIQTHTKDEIIERYGEFDACENDSGYYKTREISPTSFDAIKISFDEDGTVKNIDMDAYYAKKGG